MEFCREERNEPVTTQHGNSIRRSNGIHSQARRATSTSFRIGHNQKQAVHSATFTRGKEVTGKNVKKITNKKFPSTIKEDGAV